MVLVREAADMLGVSTQRVRALIGSGLLPAVKVGSQWDIDSRAVGRPRRVGRPMSARIALAFAHIADGEIPRTVGPQELYRLRRKVADLRVDPTPALRVASWLARRCERIELWAAHPRAVVADERLRGSGVCDRRSGFAVAEFAEGYLSASALRDFQLDHRLLTPRGRAANVILHATPAALDVVPLMFVIADLAEYGPGRESARADELVRSWLEEKL
jgi:excisionase family DNA binding protein